MTNQAVVLGCECHLRSDDDHYCDQLAEWELLIPRKTLFRCCDQHRQFIDVVRERFPDDDYTVTRIAEGG